MQQLSERMLPHKDAIQKIKNGFMGELTPMTSCYNWVGTVIKNNPGKLDYLVVALYGLPGKDLVAHAAIEHPDGTVVTEQPGMPDNFRNKQGKVDRSDFQRHVMSMKEMVHTLQESSDLQINEWFGLTECRSKHNILSESDTRVDELFTGGSTYEYHISDLGNEVLYQFLVPGSSGSIDDEDRSVITLSFKYNDYEWIISFTDNDSEHVASKRNNGTQFKILNTILELVRNFLSDHPRDSFSFMGLRSRGNGVLQGDLYKVILNKLRGELTSLGFKAHTSDKGHSYGFSISPISEQKITELFNGGGILPYTKLNNGYSFEYNNTTYKVYARFNEFFFEVGDGSVEPTGLNNSSEFKIIETLFALMKKIVEDNPSDTNWVFSGEIQEKGNRVSGLGRMYHAICKKDFTPWMVSRGFVAYHNLNDSDYYSFIYELKEVFDDILDTSPEDLQYIDVNQLYGYDRNKFKSMIEG